MTPPRMKGPPLGAHMSISGGLVRAVERAASVGATALQIFTSSNNQWHVRKIPSREIDAFRQAVERSDLRGTIAHNSYLINFGSPKRALWRKSLHAMLGEIDRADRLGIDHLVFHPGAHIGTGVDAGIARIAEAVNELFERRCDMRTRLCFEVTAGQGSSLGCRFEHLAALFDRIEASGRMGLCLDTCHLFASGYDIRTAAGWKQTLGKLERIVGKDKVRCLHLNDSKRPLDSRVDRHEHIGEGFLGREAFRAILNDRRLRNCPMVLETPKGEDLAEDRRNLGILRDLVK